ncbi:MAG: fructose-1,6-bisphosphatase [Ruminococcaceae bacterium]|nr:fructose-1,6-bisphosphatase [Oscillospiraceae bacterium]
MKDIKFLRLLAKEYPTISSAKSEIIRYQASLSLPKGTEFFFSDLHGEHDAFIHLLRSSSGNTRTKISEMFHNSLTEEEKNQLANLIYNPKKVLSIVKSGGRLSIEWMRLMIFRLVRLARYIGEKYSKYRIGQKTPEEYRDVLLEIMFLDDSDPLKQKYLESTVEAILENNAGEAVISNLCYMIQNVSVDTLHIIGDIFDRGPGPHIILDELMDFPDVDIQWGNHDIVWMGAAAGCEALIMNALRIGIGYNSFDFLEDGYGINLRPLATFAAEVYADDPCTRFKPKHYDENKYSSIDEKLAAKMHKAVAVIQFKLEGQLYNRNPEFEMEDRKVLEMTDFKEKVYIYEGEKHPLLDENFPTIDPEDPTALTDEEKVLVDSLVSSFNHSWNLHNHIKFLYDRGSTYLIRNNNLLFHGCIPMTKEGMFSSLKIEGKEYAGKELMDKMNDIIRDAYFLPKNHKDKQKSLDYMLYLWCGPLSPMFGKSRMATFENFFVEDKRLRKEEYNPYYEVSEREYICRMILSSFGLDPDVSRIINGHVPVKIKDGENPVKANGKLYVIDGGISKAYQAKTGIAGYTLIYSSTGISLAEHKNYEEIESDSGSYTPAIDQVEYFPKRHLISDTDAGKALLNEIEDLKNLVKAYESGIIKEERKS